MDKRIIRPAEPRDVDTLASFEIEISRISFGDEAVTDPAFHAKRLRKALDEDGGGLFVLEDDGLVAGWLWMDIRENYITKERYVNFRSFYIAEPSRGRAARNPENSYNPPEQTHIENPRNPFTQSSATGQPPSESSAAEALLAHGLAYCKREGAKHVVGKVHAGNLAMRALYKQAGFTATHITMELHYD